MITSLPLSQRNVPALVRLRAKLLRASGRHRSWDALEGRIREYLEQYFTQSPPQLRRIVRSSPKAVLQRIVEHEAVHGFRGLSDVERRVAPDRRCYALFSDAMPGEPLAFTELAFTVDMSAEVNDILRVDSPIADVSSCKCAMFYSISSCHDGLRGVPFGNLLIRRVVDLLMVEQPWIRTFATLSPVPGFRTWLRELAREKGGTLRSLVATLESDTWLEDGPQAAWLESELSPLCASYLLRAKRGTKPLDEVARFHLGNGARIERLNWRADTSPAGLTRSAGLMVNYLYDLDSVDANHAAYHTHHAVIAAHGVQCLARQADHYIF